MLPRMHKGTPLIQVLLSVSWNQRRVTKLPRTANKARSRLRPMTWEQDAKRQVSRHTFFCFSHLYVACTPLMFFVAGGSVAHSRSIAPCMQRIGLGRCMWEHVIGRPGTFLWPTLPAHSAMVALSLSSRGSKCPYGIRAATHARSFAERPSCVVLLCASPPTSLLVPDIPVTLETHRLFFVIINLSCTPPILLSTGWTGWATQQLTCHSRH